MVNYLNESVIRNKIIFEVFTKMAFDPNLDVKKFSEEIEFETTKVEVSIHSYNDGPAKMQLGRKNLRQSDGEWTFSKLGRMTKEEAEKVIPAMQKAIESM